MERFRQLSAEYPLRVSELVRFLREDGKDFPLDGQLLQCALDAGMACRDGPAEGRPEDPAAAAWAVDKIGFILDMAVRAGYLSQLQGARLRREGQELLDLLRERAGPEETEGGCEYEKAN